mgnify:CR=1 FL=1
MEVTGKTLIGEIVMQHPEAVDVLMSIGMHCLGCAAASNETVEEACMVHGVNADEFLDALNAYLGAVMAE